MIIMEDMQIYRTKIRSISNQIIEGTIISLVRVYSIQEYIIIIHIPDGDHLLRQPGHQQFQPNNSIPIPPPPPSRQGYSFQNFTSRQVGRGQQGYSHRLPQPGRGNGGSAPIRSGVSSDVMKNLRNQQSSTLNRSKTNNDQRR